MRIFFYIFLVVVIACLYSCKTKEEVVSNDVEAPNHGYKAASLPKMESEEKIHKEDASTDLAAFAIDVAEAYCAHQRAISKNQESSSPEGTVHINELANRLSDLLRIANEKYPTDPEKTEFDNLYSELIQNCD